MLTIFSNKIGVDVGTVRNKGIILGYIFSIA